MLSSDEPIAGFQSVDITTLAEGPDGHLWVGIDGETNGFMRIDLATQMVADEMVVTGLRPIGLTFVTVATE